MAFLNNLLVLFLKNFLLRARNSPFVEGIGLSLAIALIVMTRIHNHPLSIHLSIRTYNISEPVEVSVGNRGGPYGGYSGHVLIGYAPLSKASEKLMKKVRELFIGYGLTSNVTDVQMVGFHSEFSMMEFVEKFPEALKHAYVFTPITAYSAHLPKNLKVVIRPVARFDWMAWERNPDYRSAGELYIMKLLMEAFSNIWTQRTHEFKVYTREVWNEPVRRDPILGRHMVNRVATYITLLTTIIVARSVYNIAKERETRIQVTMSNVGVGCATYWISWYMWMFLVFNIIAMLLATVMVMPLLNNEPIFLLTSPVLVFFHFFTLSACLPAYCILGSVLFPEPKACVAMSCFLYVSLFYLLRNISTLDNSINLLINISFFNGLVIISIAEKLGKGIDFSNMGVAPAPLRISLLEVELSSYLAALLYLILAWLLHTFVTNRTIFTLNWFAKRYKITREFEESSKEFAQYQELPADLVVTVQVNKLSVLGQHELFNLNLNMYEDQVTVLVSSSGRNSLIDVLTGEVHPTHGTVTVYGKDVVKDRAEVLRMSAIGLHDDLSLYTNLTVWDNLKIFSYLKQYGHRQPPIDVVTLCSDFSLTHVQDKLVSSLKPSDKRMLQVAITLAGSSKVIIMQEPTLDMDSANTHRFWNIISRLRQGRTIIVSTKNFELAEKIGDRLIFFVGGHMICSGSVPFLRKLLGAGYYLTVKLAMTVRADRIKRVVRLHIPDATVLDDKPGTITFLLPLESTALFYGLFSLFEKNKKEMYIESFSVNAKTIDEGFKRLLFKSKRKDSDLKNLLSETTLCSYSPAMNRYIKESLSPDQGQKLFKYPASLNPSDTNAADVKGSAVDENITPSSSKRQTTETEIKELFAPLFLSVKNLNKGRLTGYKLLFIRVMALISKKILFSSRTIIVEILQVLLIVLLARTGRQLEVGGLSRTLSLSAYHRVQKNAFITVSPKTVLDNVSESLVQNFLDIVSINDTRVVHYDAHNVSLEDIMLMKNKLISLYGFGAVFESQDRKSPYKGTIWHSSSAAFKYREMPMAVATILNSFLKTTTNSNHYVEFDILPAWLERDKEAKFYEFDLAYDVIQLYLFTTTTALFFVPYMLVLENKMGMKHLQYLAGVSPIMYWSVHFVFDFISYLMLCYVFWAFLLLFGALEASAIKAHLGLAFFCNGLMMLPYLYTIQQFFNSPPLAVMTVISLNYILGEFYSVSEFYYMEMNTCDNEVLFKSPSHLLPNTACNIIQNYRGRKFCGPHYKYCNNPKSHMHVDLCCREKCLPHLNCNMFYGFDYLDLRYPGMGMNLIAMLCHAVFWTIMLMLIEYGVLKALWFSIKRRLNRNTPEKSKDHGIGATDSRRRQATYSPFKDKNMQTNKPDVKDVVIQCIDLTKTERKSAGVVNLNLTIQKSEVLCIVGSDSGTTSSVLDLMSGRYFPTSGCVLIQETPLTQCNFSKIQCVGYCPETNASVPFMTGREILMFYATLKGIAAPKKQELVKLLLNTFRLDDKADKKTCNYGQAQRRRLSLAMAFLGDPDILLLNDATNRLDNQGKKLLRDMVLTMRSLGKTVVLSSNDLESCADLATQLAMMVNGKLVCMNTPAALRDTFCNSYTLMAKIDSLNNSVSTSILVDSLRQRFTSAVLIHDQQDFIHLHVPYMSETMADIFALMESTKKHLKILDYTVRHTNLNHVMYFLEKAEEESSQAKRGDLNDTLSELGDLGMDISLAALQRVEADNEKGRSSVLIT